MFAHSIRTKRQHLQRRLAFEKPVHNLHLRDIVEKDPVMRTDTYTDNTVRVEKLAALSDTVQTELQQAGYWRASDLATVTPSTVTTEVDISYEKAQTLIKEARNERTISFMSQDTVYESVERPTVVERLVTSRRWCCLFMLEIGLYTTIHNRLKAVRDKKDIQTKRAMIEQIAGGLINPEEHVDDISYFTGATESYVTNVLSGRVDSGVTDKQRTMILERDNHLCQNCGNTEKLEVHHVIPVNENGDRKPVNLCTLCANCHFTIGHGETTAEVPYQSQDEFWNDIIGEQPPTDSFERL